MKIAVVGSRSIKDNLIVDSAIRYSPFGGDSSPKNWDVTLVSGGADGVDTGAEIFAKEYGVDIEVIEPDYDDWSGDEHPAKRRNTRIVEAADAVVAVWDGRSNGTRDTIDKALDRGKPIYVKVVE